MARVTVEDCVLQVPNRFELVMLAAHRARALASGAELLVDRDRDKNPVVSLREIAETKLDLDSLNESLVKSLQKRVEPDSPEEEVMDLLASKQQSWVNAAIDADEADDDEGDLDTDLDEEEGATRTADFGDVTFEDTDVTD